MTPVAAPPRVHTVIPGLMVLRLFAGRGAFRGAGQVMAVVLAVVWGTGSYAVFANAIGVCGWLVFVPTAAEKVALKLVPRSGVLAADVARLAVRTAGVPALALLVVLLVTAASTALTSAPGPTAQLYLAAATWSVSTGALMTLSGLHRLRGRPELDARAFGAAAAVLVGVTAVTVVRHLAPATHLLLLSAGLAPVTALSAAALPGTWRRGRGRRRLLPLFARSLLLLGLSELVDAVAVAVLFTLLAATGRLADSGPFYLTLLPYGVLCSFAMYLLRLRQPATSQRLRGGGAAAGRAQAVRLLRRVERAGAVVLVVLAGAGAAVLVSPGLRDAAGLHRAPDGAATAPEPRLFAVLAVLGLVETVCYLTVLYASYLLENTTGAVLVRTANAAVARLAVAVGTGALLVPAFGAPGAYTALVVSLVVHAGLLRRLVRRFPMSTTPAAAPPAPSPAPPAPSPGPPARPV